MRVTVTAVGSQSLMSDGISPRARTPIGFFIVILSSIAYSSLSVTSIPSELPVPENSEEDVREFHDPGVNETSVDH